MSWETRLLEAAYTSPTGKRIKFVYEDVSRTFEKRTAAFDFPDADGTYVQDMGKTGHKFPLNCIFTGEDSDLEALKFENMLSERGVGKLEHPVYGVFDVVPFGEIERIDSVQSAANQTIVKVVFFETNRLVYPTSQQDPESIVVNTVGEVCEATALDYEEVCLAKTVAEKVEEANGFQQLLDSVDTTLRQIATAEQEVYNRYNAINQSVNQAIDTLVDDPLTLAFQTVLMIQAPARAYQSITARLEAYANLTQDVIQMATDLPDFYRRNVFANSLMTGSILSVVNHQFLTKKDALTAANALLDQFDAITEWRDDQRVTFDNLIDTGETYQRLQEAVAVAAGYLVEMSFTLRKEYTLVLNRNRSIVDLVGELYGSVDDYLDFFIESNNLSGAEIIELLKGRTVVYYR